MHSAVVIPLDDVNSQTTKESFKRCSDKKTLLEVAEFGNNRTPKTIEYIDEIFAHVLNNSIENLHDIKHETIYVNPFMIGITYIHRMVYFECEPDFTITDTSLGALILTPAINEIVKKLKKDHLINSGVLSGIVFIADGNAKLTAAFKTFENHGAVCIGTENRIVNSLFAGIPFYRNAAYLVAKQYVVFAINEGIDVLLKQCAEYHCIYTASFLKDTSISLHITITTRLFDDMKSLAAVMGKNTTVLKADERTNCKDTPVVISLGWKSYNDDVLLYKLGEKLARAGHPITYYFFDNIILPTNILHLMSGSAKWTEMRGEGPGEDQKFQISLVPSWAFVIHCVGCAELKIDGLPFGELIDMVLPLPQQPGISFQVTRHTKSPQTMFDFCGKLVTDYLSTLKLNR